jgi:hypothetical protein
MENHLCRKLSENEVVHHINENKQDNRLENLELMTRKEHMKFHSLKNYKNKIGNIYNRNQNRSTN